MKKAIILTIILSTIAILSTNKNKPTEYTSYVVGTGDTLTSIAQEITPNDIDYRYTVEYIKEKNNIDSNIKAGQDILIPQYER